MIFNIVLFGLFTISSGELDYDGKYNYLLTHVTQEHKVYSVEFRSEEKIDTSNIKYVGADCFSVRTVDEKESDKMGFWVTGINYLCSMKEIAWKTQK